MRDMSYADVQKNAAHIIALGTTEVYIQGKDAPWSLASKFESGGSHRLDVDTSGWFTASHAIDGLSLRWSFDIEPYSASGSPQYHIDADACRTVLRALTGNARKQFRDYLAECATKVRAKGLEYQAAADRQANDAAILTDLAQTQ